jgi:hypothetical protein
MPPMPHDVFLSYASTDRAAAEAVCAALETRGIRCWIAPRDVPAGADWGEAILTAIGRAHAMVLVLSRTTAASVHVRNEVVTAVSQSLALVPVRVEDCQPSGALRLHLAGSHWLNVFPPPIEQHADVLAVGVRLALAADATVEIPRAQAAALVAAARASSAAPGGWPATPPAASATIAVGDPEIAPAPAAFANPAVPRRRAGMGVLLGLGALVALVALGAAAWLLEPRLRTLVLGESRDAPAVMIESGLPTAADAAPAAAAEPMPAPAAGRMADAAPAQPPPPPRALAPTASLAGLGGVMSLPQASAPPPLPAPARFAQAAPIPAPAPAAGPAARVMNVARETISRLFVAPMGEGVGREDWLGHAQITPGNAVQIRAPEGQGCVFNIRAVYVGGRTEDRPGVDLCAAPELRFEGGKGTGAASSR